MEAGAQIGLCLPNELLNMSPGFYMALGNRELPPDGAALIRFYWHLTPDTAAAFVRKATARLNDLHLAFRLKVLRDPALYTRCDAGVVYALAEEYSVVSEVLADVHGEIASGLRPSVPAFVKQLAPGLGFAEDPGGWQSFGEHRCRLLADALVSAFEADAHTVPDRVATVVDRFAQEGIDLDAPFLNSGSTDRYATFRFGVQR
jgi:hypothetical protein